MHLAGVGVGELAELQIEEDQAAQAAMEEEQVHAIPVVADAQAALAADEGEVVAEFEQEAFQMADEGFFQLGLGVFILQVEELQDERIFDSSSGRDGVSRLGLCALREHGGLVPRERGALVELSSRSGDRAGGRTIRRGGLRSGRSRGFRASGRRQEDVVRPREGKGAARSPRVKIRDAVADFADAVCTIGSTAASIDTVDKIVWLVEWPDAVGPIVGPDSPDAVE